MWSMSFVGTLRIRDASQQAVQGELGMLEGTGDKEKQEIALKAAISGLRKHSSHLFCNENAIGFFFAVKA